MVARDLVVAASSVYWSWWTYSLHTLTVYLLRSPTTTTLGYWWIYCSKKKVWTSLWITCHSLKKLRMQQKSKRHKRCGFSPNKKLTGVSWRYHSWSFQQNILTFVHLPQRPVSGAPCDQAGNLLFPKPRISGVVPEMSPKIDSLKLTYCWWKKFCTTRDV